MTPKEFFDAVVEMRLHQRAYFRSHGIDKTVLRYSKEAEAKVDKEIAHVQLLTKEQQQPRLDFGP